MIVFLVMQDSPTGLETFTFCGSDLNKTRSAAQEKFKELVIACPHNQFKLLTKQEQDKVYYSGYFQDKILGMRFWIIKPEIQNPRFSLATNHCFSIIDNNGRQATDANMTFLYG